MQNASKPKLPRHVKLETSEDPTIDRTEKVKVIDDLFKEFVSQPTQDMIISVNNYEESDVISAKESGVSEDSDQLDQMIRFYLNDCKFTRPENLSDCIVDDVLSAMQLPNSADKDCY